MRAGLLNKYITIETPTETQNSVGQPVKTWATHAQVWAAIQPMRMQELLAAQQISGKATVKIRIRALDKVENWLTYSEQFDHASWTKADITVTSNAITAPDGSGAADKLEDISAVSNAFAMQAPFTLAVGMKYTMSCYLKKGTTVKTYLGLFNRTAMAYETAHFIDWTTEPPTLNLQAGTGTGALITVGNGWYRLVSTSAAVTVGTALGEWYIFPAEIALGTPDGYIYAWGAQFATGADTPYIRTEATAYKTRQPAVTEKMRVNWDGKIYNIEGPPMDQYERGREMILMCSEGVNDG